MMNKRDVNIVPPVKHTGIKKTKIKDHAGGIPALYASYKHVKDEIGLIDGIKILNNLNKSGGFDCPGCAWPDPKSKVRSKLGEYCENGVKAIAEEATKKRVTPEFFHKYSVQELSTWTDYEIGKSGRITHPVYLEKGSDHYKEISWEDAFKIIAKDLKEIDNPNEAVFYTSGRTSNEAAFLYQLFAKLLGTNNLPDCSNMCHESSGVGLSETLGIGKGSVTLEDIYEAEVVMVMGQNPGTNHPRMMSALKKCKDNGGTIVSINPLPEAGTSTFIDPQSPFELMKGGTKLADHFLQVKVNGDVALLKTLMHLLWKKEEQNPGKVFDLDFIKEKTEGFEGFINSIRNFDSVKGARACGISLDQIEEIANLLANKSKIIVCWAMGLTQHLNGVNNIKEVVNLLLLKGSIGKPGAGTCPVRGHSNVQGDRTVGIYEKPSPQFIESLEKRFNTSLPKEHGYDVVDCIKAMHESKIKVFIGMGGNFISATPDSQFTGEAMQNCRLTVQISTKLNRSHLVTGEHALILPCLARTEIDVQHSGKQFVSVENSMGIVHSSKGMWKPASDHLLSEPDIVARMARATFSDQSIDWKSMIENYDVIRDHIEAVIPGFENYNKRVRGADGFYLPNGARHGDFKTSVNKAIFTEVELPTYQIKEGNFILTTIRTHDQYNTTIYGLDDRYRGILNERRVVLMNQDDMKKCGFKENQKVRLTSHFKGEERIAEEFLVISFDIARGCVASYFPETNVLVPINSYADKSQTPTSKYIEVSITAYKD